MSGLPHFNVVGATAMTVPGSAGPMRLITRGDDAGLCASGNFAIAEACRNGILRNVSILAVGPALAHAAEVLRGLPGIALGLHATLTCEWAGTPWGPVSPPSLIPSLLNHQGLFPKTIEQVPACAEASEIAYEVRAQLNRLRQFGVDPVYLDDHMAFAWHPRIKAVMLQLAADEGLVFGDTLLNPLPYLPNPSNDPIEDLCQRIEAAPPGCHLLVLHPGAEAADMRAFCLPGEASGVSAKWRAHEFALSTHPRVLDVIHRRSIHLLRYDQVDAMATNLAAG